MTNKLVAIINSLKVPKIKENFTTWNEISCTKLQLPPEPLTRGLPHPNPRSVCPLSSTEFVEPPPPARTKFLGMPLDSGVWDVTVSLDNSQHFEVTYCLHSQGHSSWSTWPLQMTVDVPSHEEPLAQRCSIISQKTGILVYIYVKHFRSCKILHRWNIVSLVASVPVTSRAPGT